MIKYKIFNNFLEKSIFNKLIDIKYNEVNPNEAKVYNNRIDQKENIINTIISKDLLKELNKNCHTKALEILKELCPKKIKVYEYSEFHLNIN